MRKRRPRAKPPIHRGGFDPQSKDGIWEGLVRIQRVEWATGKIRYRIDCWNTATNGGGGWNVHRWCNWLLPTLIYAHFAYKKLRKDREPHGDTISMNTIIS